MSKTLDKKVINREIRHMFVGEEKWWLQVWGKELFKESTRAGVNAPVLKLKDAKYAVSLERSSVSKHINLGLQTFPVSGDTSATCRVIS